MKIDHGTREIRVGAAYDVNTDGFRIGLRIDGRIVTSFQLADDVGDYPMEPLLAGKEGHQFLQEALEAAWRVGLRPRDFKELTGEMAATVKHLEDMRAIAFSKLGMDRP